MTMIGKMFHRHQWQRVGESSFGDPAYGRITWNGQVEVAREDIQLGLLVTVSVEEEARLREVASRVLVAQGFAA